MLSPKGSFQGNLARKDADDAIVPLRRAVALDPGRGRAYRDLGKSCRVGGRLVEAVEALAIAVVLEPADVTALHEFGRALAGLDRHAEAIAAYRRAVAQDPSHAQSRRDLGKSYRAQGRPIEAAGAVATAIAAEPADVTAQHEFGRILSGMGRHGEAVVALRRTVALEPDRVQAHRDLWKSYRALGRHAEAAEAIAAALERFPRDATLHYEIGKAFAKLGRHDDAIDAFLDSLEIDPEKPDAHRDLGSSYRIRGDCFEAIASLTRSMELSPGHASAHYQVGRTFLALGRQDAAVEEFRQAIRLDPRQAPAYFYLGRALHRLGRTLAALQALSFATRLNVSDATAFHERGRLLAVLGRHAEAAEAFRRTVELDPDRTDAASDLDASLDALRDRSGGERSGEDGGRSPAWPKLSLCFLRALTGEDLAWLDGLDGVFVDVIALSGTTEAGLWAGRQDIRAVGGGWQACIAEAGGEWLLPIHAERPDAKTLDALCRRVGAGIGAVSSHPRRLLAGATLFLSAPLKACLEDLDASGDWDEFVDAVAPLLRCRPLGPFKGHGLRRPAFLPGVRDAWIIPPNDEDWFRHGRSAVEEIASVCQALGHHPVLIECPESHGDVPTYGLPVRCLQSSDASFRREAIRNRPAVVHVPSNALGHVTEALQGFDIPVIPFAHRHPDVADGTALDEPHTDPAAPAERRVRIARVMKSGIHRVACAVGSGIGNMIQCSPAIRKLAEHLGQPVDVIVNGDFPGCECLFAGAPWVGSVVQGIEAVTGTRFDAVFVFPCFGRRVGTLNADQVMDAGVGFSFGMMRKTHEAEFNLLCMKELLGVPYAPTDASRYFLGRYDRGGPVPGRVGLHAGCKPGIWDAKRWPHFKELATRLTAEGFEVVSFGSRGEHVDGTIDATGTPLKNTVEALRTCSYLIANDSGLMHVGDALKIPLTAIFAPTSVVKNRPLSASSQVVALSKDCAPCQFRRETLLKCRCIGEITFDEVWGRVAEHMARIGAGDLPEDSTDREGTERTPGIVEQQLAFEATARAIRALPLSVRLRSLVDGERAYKRLQMNLDRRVCSVRSAEILLRAGAGGQARASILAILDEPLALLDLGDREFERLLRMVRAVGAEDTFTTAVRGHAATIFKTYGSHAARVLDCAASVLAPDQLGDLILAGAAAILQRAEPKPVVALLDAARKYSSVSVMLRLLSAIDSSDHTEVLWSLDAAATVGGALMGHTLPPLTLHRTGLTKRDFTSAASREKKILQAVTAGNRDAFLRNVNLFLAEWRGAAKLGKLLRTFALRIAQFGIRGGEVWYDGAESLDDILHLAVILNDAETMDRAIRDDAMKVPVQLLAAWRSRRNDYDALNGELAAWLRAEGADPIRLEGTGRVEVFRSCFQGYRFDPAKDRGKISVVLTVFNPDAEYLRLAVESVLGQTYRNLELIIVDDGSDRVDPAGMEAFAADPRVRLLRNPRNAGPYHCRNQALAVADGAFVTFHDGDDVAHPQRLEVQLGALLESEAYQVCFAAHLRFDAQGGLQFEINPDVLNLRGDGPVTALFRRSVFDAVGPFAPVRSRGDIEMRSRVEICYGKQAMRRLEAPLMYCSGDPGSLSNVMAAQFSEYVALFRHNFRLRALPPVLDGRMVSTPPGGLAVPFVLRSGTPHGIAGMPGAS